MLRVQSRNRINSNTKMKERDREQHSACVRKEKVRKSERGTQRAERAKQQAYPGAVVERHHNHNHNNSVERYTMFLVEGTFLLVVFYKGTQCFTTSRYEESYR